MKNVSTTLNIAVHGHEKAKRQVERIIGQWVNGEKTGYCFGFEGPPGVGKTSLAKKGIAECLIDNDSISRPFSFIAIGGSSNGSTLEGHNYTYVGSTWGKIVDILIEKKCMNPIIFIDELDKVSRTEHGKEIIGVLTHLIDQTQNDLFQDKYFNGIDLDLSKALFIFSYNDPSLIDKILLDRIHRVKFNHLTIDDKLTITRNYILPEIYSKMGLKDVLSFTDDVIENIIEKYTNESGVRKLKEILFEIIGEINLSILKDNIDYDIPLNITIDDISNKYLKDRQELLIKKIFESPSIGIINGLWANSLGNGGILHIEVCLFPTNNFLELKLTGMQGDVMKESMNVAKTLAWSLLEKENMKSIIKDFDSTKLQGLHIHCPEGATPKDGPSAGAAITTAIYSLMVNKKIKNDFAITGEICLQGKVTAIGGLDLKILGGIKAGVKHFIYPCENSKDFNDFYDRYKNKSILNDIKFYSVNTIQDVFSLILE
jgi:endopeptidase La